MSHDPAAIETFFLEAHRPPGQIILDLDATDDPLHGEQEGRFFHGYYDCYCYQLDLFADRTSAATMRANQLRLWFASMAYVLLCALRRIGLVHTQFADATCGTIRLKLLKIGALGPSAFGASSWRWLIYPWHNEFALAHLRLQRAAG